MSQARFAQTALRLAGLAGWHLGWSAEQFWAATPAEMEAVVAVMLGADGSAEGGALTQSDMARLQEMFPDG
ncbi:MAG: phage tail assembly chaperone [Sphingomonadaceae bacterium]|jgi:hypothetical protein